MSKADELFKKLEYEITKVHGLDIFRKNDIEIRFWEIENKPKIEIYTGEDVYFQLGIEDLQAINEKVKELGWI